MLATIITLEKMWIKMEIEFQNVYSISYMTEHNLIMYILL